MLDETLQTKYRPHSWEAILGQDSQISILKGIIAHKSYTYTRSYVFYGHAGCGKTTTAKVFANAIFCDSDSSQPCGQCDSCLEFLSNSYPDFIEKDAGSYNKVEDIKQLLSIASIYPQRSNKYRVILLDEAHRISNAGWDAMLKFLEEGKTQTIFLFATTEVDKIRPAILSRAINIHIRPLSVKEIYKELINVLTKSSIAYDSNTLYKIACANAGKMRDALKSVDMYARAYGEIKNIELQSIHSQMALALKHCFFGDIQEAISIVETLTISGHTHLGDLLASVLSAIWLYPQETTIAVDDMLLNELKTLFNTSLKSLINQFFTYKPQTLEQIKLFFAIITNESKKSFSQHSGTRVNSKRQLFHKEVTESQHKVEVSVIDEDFE